MYAIGERRRTQRRRRSADSSTDSMSSFDPDDTTPLINPQNNSNNTNHGTFAGDTDDAPLDALSGGQEASDDEMLDSQQASQPNQRFNPFNRVPNLPPQLADELAVTVNGPDTVNIWGRFKRYFIRSLILVKINISFIAEFLPSIVNNPTMMLHYSAISKLQRLTT